MTTIDDYRTLRTILFLIIYTHIQNTHKMAVRNIQSVTVGGFIKDCNYRFHRQWRLPATKTEGGCRYPFLCNL